METKQTLVEKYFPKIWEDLILPDNLLTLLSKTRQSNGYRLLLHSSPGTGKTSSARLITLGDDTMYLSGSNDFKIETIRSKIMPFATGMSVFNKKKTIIVDEFSGVRNDLQENFMIILDQCKSVNFIFLTNFPERINAAVKSRCTKIDYDFVGSDLEEHKRKFIEFALKVCQAENIAFDKAGLNKLYKLNFPNFRNLLYHLQELKDRELSISVDSLKSLSDSGKKDILLYELIENPKKYGEDLFAEITQYKGKEKEALLSLGDPFYEYLNDKGLYDKTLECAQIVSKYSNLYLNTINVFTTFFSCIIELKSLFK